MPSSNNNKTEKVAFVTMGKWSRSNKNPNFFHFSGKSRKSFFGEYRSGALTVSSGLPSVVPFKLRSSQAIHTVALCSRPRSWDVFQPPQGQRRLRVQMDSGEVSINQWYGAINGFERGTPEGAERRGGMPSSPRHTHRLPAWMGHIWLTWPLCRHPLLHSVTIIPIGVRATVERSKSTLTAHPS